MTTLKVLKRTEIHAAAWDSCLEKSAQFCPYAYSWYLDLACSRWEAIVWQDGTVYKAIMPVPLRKYVAIVEQPYFCQQLGIFSSSTLSLELTSEFLTVFYKRYSYVSVYCFNAANTEQLTTITERCPNIHLSLLHNQFRSANSSICWKRDLNNQLKRALNFQWTFSESNEIAPLVNLFQQFNECQIQGGVSKKSYQLLKHLYKELSARKQVYLLYALYEGIPQAGILIWNIPKRRSIYLFNASSTLGRKQGARALMLSNYIKGNPRKSFDFESPQVPSIRQFYNHFNPEEETYYQIRYNRLPFPLRQLQNWRLHLLGITNPT